MIDMLPSFSLLPFDQDQLRQGRRERERRDRSTHILSIQLREKKKDKNEIVKLRSKKYKRTKEAVEHGHSQEQIQPTRSINDF